MAATPTSWRPRPSGSRPRRPGSWPRSRATAARLEGAVAARQTAEQQFGDEERHVAGLQRAAADRREGMARLHGQVNGLRSRSAAAEEEVGRLATAREAALARAAEAQRDFTSLETRVAGLDQGEEGLDSEHEEASALLGDLEDRLASIREQATTADRERSSLAARKEALEMGLNRKDGAGALLAATDSVSGLLGSVAALLSVQSGYEAAVAAALGGAADAVAVRDVDAAIGAIDHLKTDDLGRAGILLGGAGVDDAAWPGLPEGAVYAMDVVECPADLRPALSRLLFKIAVVEELVAAKELVDELPDVTAVTRDGDLLGAHFASGGSSTAPSLIEVQAAVDEATEQLARATHTVERLTFDAQTLEQRRLDAANRVDVALARLHESDATLAAVAEELAQYGSARPVRPWRGRAAGHPDRRRRGGPRAGRCRTRRAGAAAVRGRGRPRGGAGHLGPRAAGRRGPGRPAGRDGRPARPADRRGACPRPARPCRQPAAHRAGRARGPGPGDRAPRARPARGPRRPGRRRRCAAVVLARLEESVTAATVERTRVEDGRAGREQELMAVRERLRELARDLDELVNSAHRDEMARTQQRMRIEQIEERALEELGLDADGLVADYGPDQAVPFTGEVAERRGHPPERGAVRPRGADQAAPVRGAVAGPARPDQPARAGGVLRAGGAAQVPHRAARGPQEDPPRPAGHRARGRRAGRAGLHRGLRRRERGVRRHVLRGCSPVARAGWC